MPWLPEFVKAASNGNGLLLLMSTDEFFEITMYVSVPLWFLCGAWNLYILRDEHRRAAQRQLDDESADEVACPQQPENSQLSAPTCDESDRPMV